MSFPGMAIGLSGQPVVFFLSVAAHCYMRCCSVWMGRGRHRVGVFLSALSGRRLGHILSANLLLEERDSVGTGFTMVLSDPDWDHTSCLEIQITWSQFMGYRVKKWNRDGAGACYRLRIFEIVDFQLVLFISTLAPGINMYRFRVVDKCIVFKKYTRLFKRLPTMSR